MQFKEIIFVMEDVDCASSVVYARTGPKAKEAEKDIKKAAEEACAVATYLLLVLEY